MASSDTALAKARRALNRQKGILRTSEALRLGVHPRTLYALRDSGEIEQLHRGLYRLASKRPLTDPDLVAAASLVPQGVICLISALAHHRLTTQIPHAIDIALPSHAQTPRLQPIPVRAFWFPEASLKAGVQSVPMGGVTVKFFSAEKSIADAFKYRNKIGLDVAVEALRAYFSRGIKRELKALHEFARLNRVDRVMRPFLEALL